jgi:hypothetical protein
VGLLGAYANAEVVAPIPQPSSTEITPEQAEELRANINTVVFQGKNICTNIVLIQANSTIRIEFTSLKARSAFYDHLDKYSDDRQIDRLHIYDRQNDVTAVAIYDTETAASILKVFDVQPQFQPSTQ